jgi:hypothetical protein
MLNASAIYELRAIKAEINPGCSRIEDPFVCVLCDQDVPTCSVPGKPYSSYVTAVEIAQHKSSTLKTKIKYVSPAPSTAQGSLGQSIFFMCTKCIPCVKLFNQVIMAERHVQWLSQHFLRYNTDELGTNSKAIMDAFHQWDKRVLWANAVAVSFKMLHAVLID